MKLTEKKGKKKCFKGSIRCWPKHESTTAGANINVFACACVCEHTCVVVSFNFVFLTEHVKKGKCWAVNTNANRISITKNSFPG